MHCYNPGHYCANSSGQVYEHVYVMAKLIGRKLHDDECVHHIDRNRKNNDPSNLMLMTKSEHALLHAMEDRGFSLKNFTCKLCDSPFIANARFERIYCSDSCARDDKKKFEIAPEDLEFLVWSRPTVDVARILGVSDVAVAKRCKKYGIKKPGRGYWMKNKKSM